MKKILFDLLERFEALMFGILAVTGFVLLVTFLAPSSELENQVLFGLSPRRLVLGAVFTFFLIINIAAVFWERSRSSARGQGFENKLGEWIPTGMALLYLVALGCGSLVLAMIPPILRLFKFVRPVSEQVHGLFLWMLILSSFLIVRLRIRYGDVVGSSKVVYLVEQFVRAAVLFIITFFLYAHFAALIDWVDKSKYTFYDLLAGQFIKGRLFLENPPYTHDLTMYKGQWYVPMPPLPAIFMMPLAYLIGAENINAGYFSMVFSAFNGVLVFEILKQLRQRKWIEVSNSGIFWLVVVFLFGTPHFWVGINGRGWYVSQILTVAFLALAICSALRSWSPWLIGAFIAVAMTARPNSLMTWPFVFAISMQILKETRGEIDVKQAFLWSLKTAPPIALAIIGLLTYNYLRFENFLDFGYVTINGDPTIVHNVQTWGVFSPHFVWTNLQVMLFKMPRIHWGTPWPIEPKGALWPVDPTTTGMSIFAATPALIYLFRRYPKQWWIIGAWVTVLFNIILLSFYHNTGAHQFGYRYILDFLIPLIAMLAVGLNRKVPWHFIALVLVSIMINMYGAYWFMDG
jgi:hypothetical protein